MKIELPTTPPVSLVATLAPTGELILSFDEMNYSQQLTLPPAAVQQLADFLAARLKVLS